MPLAHEVDRVKSSVLIIEDDDDLRKVLAYTLRMAGHNPFTAITAEDALLLLNDSRCDLCIVDLELPRMDGLSALSAMAAKQPTFPIIAMTASADVAGAEVRARGATALIRKPFSSTELLDAVSAALIPGGHHSRFRA